MNWWRHDPRLATPEPKGSLHQSTSSSATASSTQESRHGS
jgi:hypothetical protein